MQRRRRASLERVGLTLKITVGLRWKAAPQTPFLHVKDGDGPVGVRITGGAVNDNGPRPLAGN